MVRNVFAQINIDQNIFPAAKFGDFGSLLNIIIPLTIVIAVITLLFVLMFGGYKILTAGGNPEELKKSQQVFTKAIIGIIIIVFAYLFVRILGRIFNISFPFFG